MTNILDYGKIMLVTEFESNLAKLKPFKYFTQTVLFKTHLFGKDYFWMEDVDGTTYLAHESEDGLPEIR
jgi:hypothetical protein